MLIQKKFLVFSLPSQWVNSRAFAYPLEWTWLNQETISLFFLQEKRLYSVFERFIAKGFVGIVWHDKKSWASYAWMSLPETLGPPHLPRQVRQLPVYWIFYCRTKEEYQGRGLYKASLSLLAHWARKRDSEAEVYVDTEPNNIPSRRAIETVGFLPKGVLTTFTLRLPKFSFILWGHWYPNAPHSEEGR